MPGGAGGGGGDRDGETDPLPEAAGPARTSAIRRHQGAGTGGRRKQKTRPAGRAAEDDRFRGGAEGGRTILNKGKEWWGIYSVAVR